MKLHLPTRLRAAVLACITAVAALATTVGTGALTTGVVAYTIAASQAEATAKVNRTFEYGGVTYSGGELVTIDVTNPANVTAGGAGHALSGVGNITATLDIDGTPTDKKFNEGVHALNGTGGTDASRDYTLWTSFSDVSGVGTYYGQTLRLAGASEAWSVTFDFNGMAFGGLVTEAAADGGAYALGRPQAGNAIHLVAANVSGAKVNMSIGADTTLVGGSVTVMSSGTWALGKNLTMGAATTVNANQEVTLTGVGALNISGALTLNAGSRIAAENNAIAVNGALSLDLDGITAGADAIISSAAAVSATGLTLSNHMTLEAGSYKLISTTNEAATALASLFESTEQFAVTNKSGVVTLTVADVGMVTLDADIVAGNGTETGNIHNYYAGGLNVGEHTITATYTAAGYSTLYTKGLKGSGNITFDRTFTGGNLCVLWIDGEASGYTGTIALSGPNANAFLKLGSDAAASTDLSAATVDMNKQVMALGSDVTIGTLYTTGTEIRAVDGLTSRIGEMTAGTGMTTTTTGFVQDDSAVRNLIVSTMSELTGTTIRKGVNVEVANGALTALQDCNVQGSLSNKGQLTLLGTITLSNAITMSEGANTTFANDMVLDLSNLTADAEGVYHITNGVGTTDLGSLTVSNVTGVDLVGKSLAFDNSGTITLIDNTSDLIWKGGAGTWDETSQNWTKGGDPAIFADADRVTFNDESEVTLVGDLIAGGMNVNAAVILEGSGSLDAKEITIAETGSLTINGDATVSVDREKLNKMQVSGDGTLEINKIGTDALAFDGGTAGFSGTLALTQDVAPSGHSFTTTLTNFTGTVVIDALINHADSDFGDASKLVFVGSRATNQIGFWCNTGINPTLEQDIEITGDNEVRFFLNGTTLNGNITGNKLRLQSGTGTFGGTVNLASLNLATDNLVVNLKGDATIGTLLYEGSNRTTLKVGDAEHQVTLNVTGSNARSFNAKSHAFDIAAGSVMNDNARIKLTNSTLTVQGGGVYNLKGICSSAEGGSVGNVLIASGTTLHITGTAVSSDGDTGSFMLSNWNANNTYTIRGTLISEAGISSRDGTGTLNIEDGGLLQLNSGFRTNTDRNNNATINVKKGGTLKVASTTTAYNNQIAVNLENGSVFEGNADTTTIAQNMTIVGSAETPATADFNVGADKSLTLSGVISGDNGALNKTGEGTLVLSGTNTYAGGTTVTAGTLDAVGTLGAGNVTVGTGATIILHNTVDGSVFANNGTIEIASGFAGLESAGTVGVAGATEGNGYTMGGSANLFTTSGTLTGTREATFNGANVTIAEDGSFELDTDWSTYRVKSARSETETIAAIKALATEHSASLKNLVFSDGVDAAMETMDVDGFNVELGNTSHTIGTLNITNGTVTSTCVGDDGKAFSSGAVNIGAGGKLVLTGTDAFSWCSSPSDSPVIILAGTADNTAVLELGQRMTYGKGEGENGSVISLNGYSHVTGEGGLDPVGDMNNPATVNVAAGTTNNVFDATVYKRSVMVFNVGEGAELTIGSTFADSPSGNTNVGHVTKAGAGTATITQDNTFYGLNLKAGTLVIDGADVLVTKTGASGSNGSEFNLWEQGTASGVLKLVNEANLKVDTNSNMWFHDGTSVLIEKESSFTKLATNYTMEIKAAGETDGKMIAKQGASWYYENLSSDIFYVEDAAVSISATSDANVGLKMNGASTFTNTGATTLTLTNSATTALSGVNAQGGNIALGSVASVGTMAITAGKTVSSENDLSISTALTAGAGSTLSAALTLSNGAALDLVTGSGALNIGDHAVTLGTGLTITEAMMTAITSLQAETSLTLMKGVTSLTGGALDATTVFTGLTGDYQITVEDGNLVVSAMALPAADLTWEGSDGIWGEGTPWTKDGGASAYEEGANVTINGTTPGTITVSGEQTAKNVTVATTGYTIKRADTGTNSLTIQGNLIVNEEVTLNLGFMPTLGESSQIVVNEGATLNVDINNPGADVLGVVLNKGTGAGTIAVKDGGMIMSPAEGYMLNTNLSVDGGLWLNGPANAARTLTVTEGKTMTLTGKLSLNSGAEVVVDGGKLNAGEISLGHSGAAGYKGTLHLVSGEVTTDFITITRTDTADVLTVDAGTLTIAGNTDGNAFVVGANDQAVVTIGAATLTNGEKNLTFNHGSTLTDTTVTAKEGTTITVGGTGMTTNVATGLTTNGTVTMAGTTAVTGAATVTDNGTLTIDSLAGAEGSNVTLAGTGTTTITGGTADTLTAGKDATVGDLTVKTLAGTGTLTQTSGTTLTMADGGTLSGSVTTGTITAAGSLAKTGTGTVTTGDITGTSTALTVSGGTLSSGAVTVASAEVATGATLTSSGKLTSTGALTLNGAATADSADIASVILNAGGSLTCTNDLKLGGLTLNSAITSAGVTAASLSSDALDITASADVLGALAMGAGDSLTIVGLTSQYTNGLTLNGSSDATLDAFGYKYTVESTADGIVITKADAGIVWTGGADDEWGKGGNWQGGGIPTGDDVSASFTGKGVGDVNISTDGVTIGQVIVTSHDAAAGTKSEYTFKKGELTITDDMKVLDGHVIIGTTVAAADVTIIPSSDTAVSSVTVNGEGALSVTGTLAVESATDTTAGSLTIQEGGFAGIHTLASSTADVALGGTLAVEEGVIKKLTEESGTKGNLVVGSMVAPTSLTPVVPDEVIILEDSEIDTLLVTGTGNLTTKGNLTAETSTDVAGTVTAEKNLTTGAMGVTSTGDVTVGSAAAPATLDVATLENAGTVTVYNTMKASTSVENTDTGTLDIKGELQAADASVENSKTLTVGGALAADTLTTNSGATTEAKGGATIGTSLDNHGTTTVTGNLVSADTTTTAPGSAIITNDATGTGEKLVVTGNVSGASLTTDTDATTEIGGTATLADGLTNNGTTTITGATTLGGTTENTGTLATGALTAETLNNEGSLNVTGNATVKDLSSATASSLTDVSGTLTIAEGGSLSDAGDITASALDLSNLAATDKATVGNLKTNAVTLNGLSSATTGLTVETLAAKTPGQKVTVSVADSIVDQLAALEENDTAQLVTVTDAASTGKLQLTAAAAGKIANELDKKLLTYTISDNGVLTVLDNSFDKDMTFSGNAQAGMDMATEAYLAAGGTPTGALKDVTDALKTYRAEAASADPAVAAAATSAAERLTTALSGSSIAAMGSALSGDVERQLRAIRNRTTTMGVNQAVINEGMPYYNAWVNAEGDYRKVAADGTMAGYKMMSWGGTVGMDVDVTPSFTCGLAATAMYGDFDADSTDNATGDLNTYYVSAFARYAKHRWTHTFVATAGMADTSLERTIEGHKVKGDSTGVMFGGMYEVGYVFALDKEATTCLQPVLNVSFTHASLSGYDEDGANIGLSAGDTEFNKLTVGLGARLQSVVGENIYNRSSILEARAMVKFDAGDRQGETKVSFAGAGLPTHTVKSSETGAVGAEFGVGLTVPVGGEGGNLFMDASAEIRAEYTNVNATVGYRINF